MGNQGARLFPWVVFKSSAIERSKAAVEKFVCLRQTWMWSWQCYVRSKFQRFALFVVESASCESEKWQRLMQYAWCLFYICDWDIYKIIICAKQINWWKFHNIFELYFWVKNPKLNMNFSCTLYIYLSYLNIFCNFNILTWKVNL